MTYTDRMREGRGKKILTPAERGRLGGKARLRTMTKAQRQSIARKASRAALEALSPEQRREAARKAVLARWKRYRAAKKKSG